MKFTTPQSFHEAPLLHSLPHQEQMNQELNVTKVYDDWSLDQHIRDI